jgi:hypothetical protein
MAMTHAAARQTLNSASLFGGAPVGATVHAVHCHGRRA